MALNPGHDHSFKQWYLRNYLATGSR